MMKRLFLCAPVALLSFLLTTQNTALAVLPAVHPNPVYSFKQTARTTNSLAQRIACSARQQAQSMCSVGFCYRGVKRALRDVGISLTGPAAYMAKQQLSSDKRFKPVPLSQLRAGDILVHGRSRAHPYGHIAVYLGHGQEASDHVQKLVIGGRYGGTTVFRVKSGDAALACSRAAADEELATEPAPTTAKTGGSKHRNTRTLAYAQRRATRPSKHYRFVSRLTSSRHGARRHKRHSRP